MVNVLRPAGTTELADAAASYATRADAAATATEPADAAAEYLHDARAVQPNGAAVPDGDRTDRGPSTDVGTCVVTSSHRSSVIIVTSSGCDT